MGLTDNDVDEWIEYQKHTEWTCPSGRPVTAQNFHRSLRMWGVIKKELARKKSNNSLRDELAASEEGWVLCAEECEHCDGVGCVCGIKIPPAHQSWPKPPRECPAFKAKEVS